MYLPLPVIRTFLCFLRACQVAQTIKNPPAVQETQVWSLGHEDPMEKGMATHSSVLVWRIPWAEKPLIRLLFFQYKEVPLIFLQGWFGGELLAFTRLENASCFHYTW